MTAKPGKRAELVSVIQRGIELAEEHEPGVALAYLHISPTESDDLVLYERYDSDDAFQAHLANYERIPAYGEGRALMGELLAAPPTIERLEFVSGYTRA